jgi:hypothetical protein
MKLTRPVLLIFLPLLLSVQAGAQRSYANHSVLASGSWYKLAVKQEGMYKVDASLLGSMGINTTGLSPASIRIFSTGGDMLAENNATSRTDDLYENPIEVFDGGDGVFSGPDYFIFYAPGPHRWEKDSTNRIFHHRKNLYSDTTYYYLTIGGTGKRVAQQPVLPASATKVTSYNSRYFYENDLVNLLNSGKEWFGEEFTNNPGGTGTRNFTIDWTGLQTSSPVTLISDLAGRSVGAGSAFSVKMNSQQLATVAIPAVTGYFLDPFASAGTHNNGVTVSQSSLTVSFGWNPGPAGAQGWLNWFELHGRRNLAFNGNESLLFRDWQSVSGTPGAMADFQLADAVNGAAVWDLTNQLEPVKMRSHLNGTQLAFTNDINRLHEYIAFNSNSLLQPVYVGKQSNQDLHGVTAADYIIITHPQLLTEAQRIAQFHQQRDGYKTVVVTTDQVYAEFSGGIPDPAAIRDFVKMLYDRAGATQRPRYLLLFGSPSYDYRFRIAGNANLVPGFESSISLDPLNSYTSDDFFGLLDDTDDINRNDPSHQLDIGVGRIPARSVGEAKTMVDKIIRYHTKESLGAWRNQTIYVADDRDQNLHLQDAEIISSDARTSNELFNQYKIYLDAYPLVSGSGGGRYPAVNDAIVNQVFNGALIFNYSGHGSYQRLAEEAVLTQEELNRFNNPDKLPLFITASCDFAPYDDPIKNSLGTGVLTAGVNGAIALLTTSRVVFAYSNRLINDNYLRVALKPVNGKYLSLGESVRAAKNLTMQSTGDVLNNRKFSLLGDPGMQLGFPEWQLQLDSVNGKPLLGNDTLRALGKYHFTGGVKNETGNAVNQFNGKLTVTVYDKAMTVKTLGNDPNSPVTGYLQQASVLYKGDVSVKNGRFQFSFIVPKDISYQPGNARISLYADDGVKAANGVNTGFFIGGMGSDALKDNTGPVIKPYINDERFMDGGLSNENPVLLVKLSDESGISTSGNGIGHDITAVIDGNERNILVLNGFYTSVLDSYQQGQVLFPLPLMSEGKHSVRIKAWDLANNSSEATISFVVAKQEKLQLTNLRNFPNPFTTTTTFGFEHNQPNTNLDVTIDIYNNLGVRVKQLKQTVNTAGSRNCQLNWPGVDHTGAKLPKGIYIYRVIVAAGEQKAESTRQLIIL